MDNLSILSFLNQNVFEQVSQISHPFAYIMFLTKFNNLHFKKKKLYISSLYLPTFNKISYLIEQHMFKWYIF